MLAATMQMGSLFRVLQYLAAANGKIFALRRRDRIDHRGQHII
jgi:hypothetical protein